MEKGEKTETDERENTREDELIEMTGECRFCGQQHMVCAMEKWTQPQLEEEATKMCDCDEAKAYQDALTKHDRAKKRIDELCGEGAGADQLREEIVDGLKKFTDLICDKALKEVVVIVTSGAKVRVKMLAKDKVKIERSRTKVEAFEE